MDQMNRPMNGPMDQMNRPMNGPMDQMNRPMNGRMDQMRTALGAGVGGAPDSSEESNAAKDLRDLGVAVRIVSLFGGGAAGAS